jgi:hypothetical protein
LAPDVDRLEIFLGEKENNRGLLEGEVLTGPEERIILSSRELA